MLVLVSFCLFLNVKAPLLDRGTGHGQNLFLFQLIASPHSVAGFVHTSSSTTRLECTCRPHGYRALHTHCESVHTWRVTWYIFSSGTLLLNCESTNCSCECASRGCVVFFLENWYTPSFSPQTCWCIGRRCWIDSKTDKSGAAPEGCTADGTARETLV